MTDLGLNIALLIRTRFHISLLGLILLTLAAKAQVTEHFDDGDFTSDPQWEGDVQAFIVNRYQQLQLYIQTADTSYLSTPSTAAIDATWEIDCYINCNTSAYNYVRFYLLANETDPTQGEAYYVQIGGANKDITLRHQSSEGNHTVLIDNQQRRQILDNRNESRVHVRVGRGSDGYFVLQTMVETIDTEYVDIGHAFVNHAAGNRIAVWVKNSSKNGRSFYFDNIVVEGDVQDGNPTTPASPGIPADEMVTLRHKSFSPNDDGYRDECVIEYQMPSYGYHSSISIYSPIGTLICTIADNQELDQSGTITWNGTDSHGRRLPVGAYVILFEAWNNDLAAKIRRKLTIALTE